MLVEQPLPMRQCSRGGMLLNCSRGPVVSMAHDSLGWLVKLASRPHRAAEADGIVPVKISVGKISTKFSWG